MKKALSLLLALAMLASICTVPAWAEDETLDIPVIEEIAEEELELFGEEVELYDSAIASVATSADDGMTLLSEMTGFTVTAQGNIAGHEGSLASLYNGQVTVGDDLGDAFVTNGTIREGYMTRLNDSITIDFGEKKTFSGIRIWDSSRTRYFGTYGTDGSGAIPKPGARRIVASKIEFSDDNENWYRVLDGTAVYNEEGFYSDIPFSYSSKGRLNLNARYIRFYATTVTTGWGELELEEIAMLDPINENPTWSLDGNEIPTSAIESVVAGSQWNETSYASSKAWNNDLALCEGHFWHSMPNNEDYNTDEARTLTITLKEATEIGGIRIWPRNEKDGTSPLNNTASLRKVQLLGSKDNVNWYPLTPISKDFNGTWSATEGMKYCTPVDFYIGKDIDSTVKYIKVVGKNINTTKYICVPEIQLLDADVKATVGSYASDSDVLYFEAEPKMAKFYSSLGKGLATNSGVFDSVIYQVLNTKEGYYNVYTGTSSGDPHWEIDWAIKDQSGNTGYVTVDYDLGKAHTFSAVRLFGRWHQPGQSITKGYVLVSDDGENWYRADDYSDTITTVGVSAPGMKDNNGVVNLGKYASTGEIYTDIPTTFGKDYNITARYIRIYCEKTHGGNHWSYQELMLVKGDSANATKTVAEIKAVLEADAKVVSDKIKALGADASLNDVSEARRAYEALADGAKELIDEDDYVLLENAEKLVGGKVFNMTVAENTGLREAVFTLPVRSNMTIKSVKYVDSFGNVKDGTSATTVTNDGSIMTIKIAGAYTAANGLTSYSDGSKEYYFAESNATYGWNKGDAIYGFFKGIFVRDVASDGIGDHFIEITFGDDTKETVNIKTTPVWTTLSSAAAIEGSDYTDEIAPKATWKVTTTAMGVSMAAAFDGKAEYLLRKAGSNSANRYESDYIPGKYTDTPDGAAKGNQVLLYKPVRTDFIVDTGEATAVSGIRIYPRISTYSEDKTAGSTAGTPTEIRYWGSNDGENWENLGDYNFTTKCGEKTAIFDENVSYRYYKGSIVKSNGNVYKATISISELVLIKPATVISSATDVTVDVADNKDVEYTFSLVDNETVTKVVSGGNSLAFTWNAGTLKIAKAVVATLAEGENKVTITFSNGQTFDVTITKMDTSKLSYVLSEFSSGGGGTLVVKNTDKKDVKKITLDGVEIADYVYNASITAPKYTLSEDKSEINIPRYSVRGTVDIYAKYALSADSKVELPLVITFEDDTTKECTVEFTAAWVAMPEVKATFADDEIVPVQGEWKIRTSSNINGGAHAALAFSKALKNARDNQNWHTGYIAYSGAVIADSNKGHYIDVDFGQNAPYYRGVRITERVNGSKYQKLIISGKNSDSDEWVELFNGKAIVAAPDSNTIEFANPVNYRYLRLHFAQSGHITADTIHMLKDQAYLAGESEAMIDADNRKAVDFKFYVPADATGNIKVWANDAEVGADKYTWNKTTGILTLKADYINSLAVGITNVEVQIDSSSVFALKLEVKNLYSVTYYMAQTTNARGTEQLVLNIPEGKTVSALKYGDKDVTFTQADGKVTVLRYNFRNLDSFFEVDSIILKATFTDNTTQDYNINLVTEAFSVAAGNASVFEEDEIVSDANWTVKTMSINASGNGIANIFSKAGAYWHSAYTEDKSDPNNIQAVADSYEKRHYITLSVPSEGVTFSGIRYYSRTDNMAGTWDGVSIYVKKDGDKEWTLVKSQAFNKTSLSQSRVATVYFDEAVTANEVLFVADASTYKYATAKGITLLKKGAKAPDAEADEVKIDVTPTAGGNVYVDGAPSLGSNYIAANSTITLTADAEGFKYWVDAHTGKILGKDAAGITLDASVGKDIKAVFSDPTEYEAFYAFVGRNGNKLISSGYVKKGETVTAPSATQLYTTGYEFTKWVDKNGADIDVNAAITGETQFYAVYTAKTTKQSKISVVDGTVQKADGSDEALAENTYAYDTKVKAVANDAPEGQKFAYWTLGEDIVCYTKTYIFYAPDADMTLTAVFVADDAVVTKELGITMTVSTDTLEDDAKVASFLTTRIVPENANVIETGVIYVKDGSVADLTIDKIGTFSTNGIKIKVSLSSSKASGQYKLTAKYSDAGIAARGFITYNEGGVVKTIYTDVLTIEG